LLRSLERAEHGKETWSIRQVAAYHSFDVENGRSVWITIKGNDLLQKRIMEDSIDLPFHQGAMGPDVGASFEASLATHLIFFRWCEQNWRWYIRDMEDRIRHSLVRAKTVPVDSEQRFTRLPSKTDMGVPVASRRRDIDMAGSPPVLEKKGILETIKEIRWPRANPFDRAQVPGGRQEPPLSSARRVPEGIHVLNMFNYKDLQKLSILAERLEEAALVVKLNLDTLRDVYEYYQHLPQSDDLRADVRNHMEKSTLAFLRKLRHILRSLETRHTQLVSLRKRLDNGKGLVRTTCLIRGWDSLLWRSTSRVLT
jgi:hypothetical protein